MKKNWGKIIVIVYVLLFAVNLIFATVDLDDLFLPEYIKVAESGGLTGQHVDMYSVSRENGKYYINQTIEISRNEYKQCVGSKKDFEEPQKTGSGSDGFFYTFRIKYPLEKEKFYETGFRGGLMAQRIKQMMYCKMKGIETSGIGKGLAAVFEKYDVRSGFAYYYEGDGEGTRTIYYGALTTIATGEDERYISINNAFMSELANMRLYTETGKMYPGTNTDLMAKYVEKENGKKISDYVHKEIGVVDPRIASVSNFYGLSYVVRLQKATRYMSRNALKYYRFRYFDHALKGKDTVYFKVRSCDDLTVFVYVVPGEDKAGCIVIETDDLLTRQLMINDIKLAIITDGKFPVLRGTRHTVHVLFIGMVQIVILAGAMIVKTLIEGRKMTHRKG